MIIKIKNKKYIFLVYLSFQKALASIGKGLAALP
jgi:hypothetical protein